MDLRLEMKATTLKVYNTIKYRLFMVFVVANRNTSNQV